MSYRGPTPNWRQFTPKFWQITPNRHEMKPYYQCLNERVNTSSTATEHHCSRQKQKLLLHDAAKKGDEQQIERLLSENAEVAKEVDEDDDTALHIAAIHGYAKCASILLPFIDIETRNLAGRTALHEAASKGRCNVIKLLLGFNTDVDVQDKTNMTALMLAVKEGHNDVARLLVENDADTTMVGQGYSTALSLAIRAKNEEMVKYLIKNTQCIKKFIRGHQYLHLAVGNFVSEIVELLLPLVGDINEQDKMFNTALHFATKAKNIDAVKMLLDRGADPSLWNKNGDNALHFAVEEGSVECVKALLKAECDLNKKNKQGNTPTHSAVSKRNARILRVLVMGGAILTKRNQRGLTPVDMAIAGRFQEGCIILNEALGTSSRKHSGNSKENEKSSSEDDSNHSMLIQEKVADLTKSSIRSDDSDPLETLKEACRDPMEKVKILKSQSNTVVYHTRNIQEALSKAAENYLVGNKVKLMLSKPGGTNEKELITIGDALCRIMMVSGAVPSQFAASTIILLLSPDLEIPPEILLDDFLQFVSNKQRRLLLKSTMLTLSQDELVELARVYALYGSIHVPQAEKSPSEAFQTTLKDLAFSVVCAQQKRVTKLIQKGIAETDRRQCWNYWVSYFEDGVYKNLGSTKKEF